MLTRTHPGVSRWQGVVHRDIAARNFLVSEDGRLKVADFGFARVKAAAASVGVTADLLGPTKWEAPETLTARAYGPATDVYAFGVALYEIATGDAPWVGLKNEEAAEAVLAGRRMGACMVPVLFLLETQMQSRLLVACLTPINHLSQVLLVFLFG